MIVEKKHAKLNPNGNDPMIQAIDAIRDAGGFISDVVEYNLSTAKKPQPIFAVAGALALTGSLIGRKFKDEFGTRPNVQIVSVGETTCGKDHARQINDNTLWRFSLHS